MKIDHTNYGILVKVIPGERILNTVVIIFIAPIRLEAPATCRL
jgi:hypothetical protein